LFTQPQDKTRLSGDYDNLTPPGIRL